LWIAKVMGHRDTDMIIKVYSKYIENAGGFADGTNLNAIYQGSMSREEQERVKWIFGKIMAKPYQKSKGVTALKP
jgi:hypothetical protein